MLLKLHVDQTLCRGARVCIQHAPGSFAIGADGRAAPVEAPQDSADEQRAAAAACPFFAIEIQEVSA